MKGSIKMKEFRFEGHYYRWTIIDTHTVDGVLYALAESSLGDETAYILFIADRKKITMKDFKSNRTGDITRLPYVSKDLIIDDEVYDADIMIALEDNDILHFIKRSANNDTIRTNGKSRTLQ